MLARQRPGNRDHRRECRLRLGKAGDKIGRPGTILASKNNACTAGGTRISISHMRSGPFIMDANEIDVIRIIKRIKHFHRG